MSLSKRQSNLFTDAVLMSKQIFISLLGVFLLYVFGCASASKDHNFSHFRQKLALKNYELRSSLEKKNHNFLNMTKDNYYSLLAIENPDVLTEIKSFDEIIFGTSPSAFVICMRSIRENIAICDNGYTPQIDRLKINSDIPLETLMNEIRGP